jgi:hypothetical protein
MSVQYWTVRKLMPWFGMGVDLHCDLLQWADPMSKMPNKYQTIQSFKNNFESEQAKGNNP